MDNLGDWLYIILLVIAGASGLFSSARKKKQHQETTMPSDEELFPEEQKSESKSFWDVLEDIKKEQPYIQQASAKPQQITKKQEKNITSYKSTLEANVGDDDAFKIRSESFHDAEEVKKAIIYSEILNRKY